MTKALRVWKLLCRKPHMCSREIAAEFGWPRNNVSHILQALARSGSAKADGMTWNRRWRATECPPSDRRGIHPNSAYGRTFGAVRASIDHANTVRWAMAEAGTLKFKKRKPTIAPKHESSLVGKIALEQFWTFPIKHLQGSQDVV